MHLLAVAPQHALVREGLPALPAEILLEVQVRHPEVESHGRFGRKGLRTALVLTGHHHLRAKPKSFKALIRRRHLRTPPPKPWIFSKCETSLVTDLP